MTDKWPDLFERADLPGYKSREEARRERQRQLGRVRYDLNRDAILEKQRQRRKEKPPKPRCREKKSAYMRNYYANDPFKFRLYELWKNYRITGADYEEMSRRQNHVCAICQMPESSRHQSGKVRALAVDHCHHAAKKYGIDKSVRGLLCSRCNMTLSRVTADYLWFERAGEYLSQFQQKLESVVKDESK